MPPIALGRGIVPVLIESGSASTIHSSQNKLTNSPHPVLARTGSYEQSPRLVNQYQDYMGSGDIAIAPAETQLREDLADAMRESPRDSGERRLNFVCR